MIASMMYLTRLDMQALKISDAYSLHRVVYNLFEDVRSDVEKNSSVSSGILYADKGGDWNCRKILMISNRPPCENKYGKIESKLIPDEFLQHQHYAFDVIINPTKRDKNSGKTVAICGRDTIAKWFVEKAPRSWGFAVKQESLQVQEVSVQRFTKNDHTITQGKATLKGEIIVTDREQFIKSFKFGIGRGRAFGFGLLQIVPLIN